MATSNQREQKGLEIAKLPNQVKRMDEDSYTVKSQSKIMNTRFSKFLMNGSASAQTTFIATSSANTFSQ